MSDDSESFVKQNKEDVSSDPIMDLKTGIYNLFVNLINVQILTYGPAQSVQNSIDFLNEIIYNFEQSIKENNEETNS